MVQTLCILLTAHFLGDFVLQTEWMVKRKKDPKVILLHAVSVTAVSALMLGSFPVPVLLILLGSHFAMDSLKVHLFRDGIYIFLLDQLVHIAVIYGVAQGYPDVAQTGLWLTWLPPAKHQWYLLSVTFLCGLLLCVPVGGVLIGLLTSPLLEEIKENKRKSKKKQQQKVDQKEQDQQYRTDAGKTNNYEVVGNVNEDLNVDDQYNDEEVDEIEGLRKGGRYIGWLERSLVMMLLFIGLPSGIGFLFAAKSILRFGDIKDSHQRKVAEYIIIGTFSSFGWALLTSYLTQQALTIWQK